MQPVRTLARLIALWPSHPFRALPRWGVLVLLAGTLLLSGWNIASLAHRDAAQERDTAYRKAHHEAVDKDLYRDIDRRVARGENYYTAALSEQRALHYPTKPFVAVRTPVLAWTTALIGEQGWRWLAGLLWAANVLAWFAVLGSCATRWERYGGALLAALGGALAFSHAVVYSHETLAGLMISLALALSRGRLWAGALALAVFAAALRELALPFLVLWAVLAVFEGRRREALAVAGGVVLIALGLAFHAHEVAQARLPGDLTSPGWTGLVGLGLPFYGIFQTTLLVTVPVWVAGPLAVLPLLGWWGLGGRLGLFAACWFTGFIIGVALFARQENFYWMALFVPAYAVGLAFVPRAIAQSIMVLRKRTATATT